jgi:hypothetical protein
MLKSIKEGEGQTAGAYAKGLKTGFGPTESDMSKKMEKQTAAQRAMATNVAKKMGARPGLTSAIGVQAPVDMKKVAQQQGMFGQIAEQEAATVRKTDDLRQTMAARMKEKMRTDVLSAAKRRADARQSVMDNALAVGELGVTAAGVLL